VSVRAARAGSWSLQAISPLLARVAGISRQAIYKPPRRRPPAAGPGLPGESDVAIVEVVKANPTDGTPIIAAIASRELGQAINRKRVQRIMRSHRLLQPIRGLQRRRRPGFFA
jgi:putative transposase